jgi:hypothetical protein
LVFFFGERGEGGGWEGHVLGELVD